MADSARQWTDAELEKIEKELQRIYRQARDEITAKWDAYMAKAQDRLSTLYNAYLNAPPDKKAEALAKYQKAAENVTLRNEWYQSMVDQTTYELARVNQLAVDYINGNMTGIYTVNYNATIEGLSNLGVQFNLVDEATVRRMVLEGGTHLPYKNLDIPKDMAWNAKSINNSVLQGILQGESMDDISKRIFPEIMAKTDWVAAAAKGWSRDDVIRKNMIAARRTARTMVTGAENRGRLDRYRSLEDEGVIMHKIWLATPDGRTRDWHLSMDGQEVPINEPFIDGLGYELECPGDDGAPPETVYNCRCAMRSQLIGIRRRDGGINYFDRHEHNGLHQKQMAEERDRRTGS